MREVRFSVFAGGIGLLPVPVARFECKRQMRSTGDSSGTYQVNYASRLDARILVQPESRLLERESWAQVHDYRTP